MKYFLLKKLASFALLVSTIHFAQAQKDPYVKPDPEAAEEILFHPIKRPTGLVIVEWFSMPIGDASKMIREIPDDKSRYEYLLQQTETGKATLEHFQTIRCFTGGRAATESIKELRYVTKYTNATTGEKKQDEVPKKNEKYVIPETFETRNTGETLETELVIGPDLKTMDLIIQPQIVTFAEDKVLNKAATNALAMEQPIFRTQKLTTSVLILDGIPVLLGTCNPPRFADLKEKAPSDTWLVFVTVKIETLD